MQYTDIFFFRNENRKFHLKIFDILNIFAQNIDCGYTLEPPQRGGSNEYPQSMFWIKNQKKQVYPCKHHFYYIKVDNDGVYISRTCFPDAVYACWLFVVTFVFRLSLS